MLYDSNNPFYPLMKVAHLGTAGIDKLNIRYYRSYADVCELSYEFLCVENLRES